MKIFILLILLVSCANTPQKLNEIELGMTPREVKEVLGDPDSSTAMAPYLVYKYNFKHKDDIPLMAHVFTFGIMAGSGKMVPYVVRFKKNKVDFFGRPSEIPETKEEKKIEKITPPVTNTINIGNVNKN